MGLVYIAKTTPSVLHFTLYFYLYCLLTSSVLAILLESSNAFFAVSELFIELGVK